VRSSLLFLMMTAGVAHAADPWADRVLSYLPGTTATAGYAASGTALGEPTRFTGQLFGFPAVVSPFSPPFEPDEIVSVGAGGELIVAFDEPVTDDPLNPFGIDLLVFANVGLVDDDYPMGQVRADGATFGADVLPIIEVSADQTLWIAVTAPLASYSPTLAYLDLSDPYATSPGAVTSDYTRPVDPAVTLNGLSFAQVRAAYAGSGGGTGIDLAGTGLASISYVRFTHPGSTGAFEIDGLSDVTPIPAPASALVGSGLILILTRRRRVT
jgi:hypothetical protein